jgi:hypothetical protein
MGGLPPTNKIRALAIRAGPSQCLPCCALDGMPRRALAFGGGWNHSDGRCKRFARREELEKAGANTQDKRRRRENYWRVLLARKQFSRGDPVSIGCSVWRHDEDCFIVCSPRPSSMAPTPPAASRATVCAPTRCPSRSWVNAPSRSCRRLRASPSRRSGLVAGRSLGAPCRPRPGRCRTRSGARCGAPRGGWRGVTISPAARRLSRTRRVGSSPSTLASRPTTHASRSRRCDARVGLGAERSPLPDCAFATH